MKFVALYIGSASEADKAGMTEDESEALMADWGRWMVDHQSSIVDPGTPLGKTGRVSSGGIGDVRNNIVAYIVVEAISYDAAAQMFTDHPHLRLHPGNAIEVMESISVPGV